MYIYMCIHIYVYACIHLISLRPERHALGAGGGRPPAARATGHNVIIIMIIVYVCMYVYIYIYIYIYTYIQTYALLLLLL